MGFRPIILERGKAVRERTKDTFGLWRKGVLNPESNVQFGEGGAGTFSDGKLYSQIKDPHHLGRKVLDEFVKAGAPEDILYLSRPHIGTFRLVSMVEKMRATIHELGGEVRFETRSTTSKSIRARCARSSFRPEKRCAATTWCWPWATVRATTPSRCCTTRGVYIEAKPFSLGFRIEHPQGLIDRSRFGKFAGHKQLGAADYKVVHHCSNGRAVYSFCMCPGGTVVAATSEPGRVVTNGMSQYSRAERNANAGIVVGITPDDFPWRSARGHRVPAQWEERAFELGGADYHAPVNWSAISSRAGHRRRSAPWCRRTSPVCARPISAPRFLTTWSKQSVKHYRRSTRRSPASRCTMPCSPGVETRTSSPIRIRRKDDYQSVNVEGLYPAGEGAGYAGGIYSAAIDGIEVAQALASI